MKTRYKLDEDTGKVLFEGKYKVENKYKWLMIREATVQELLFKFALQDLNEGGKNGS